jgi:all-trans-8'-apo-beta-carotenal 15,15'-oxygenase
LPIDHFPFAHDFAVSGKYAIFFINSINMGSFGPVLLGTRTIGEGVSFDDTIPMQIAVVDLDTMNEVRRFETDPGAIIHFGNAFEEGDEVVIDAMHSDNFEANEALSDIFNAERLRGGEFRRYRLNMVTGGLSYDQMSPTNSEFPTFNQTVAGTKHEVTYSACSVENGHDSFFNGIQRVGYDGDIQLNTLDPGLYGSEPLFAPSKHSSTDDDGYLLEVLYDAHRHISSLLIFRAADISEPVATLDLRHHLPHQFHGFWHDQVLLEAALA